MMHKLFPALWFATTLLSVIAGCTYYVPAKLETHRTGDVLTVSLAGPGTARWDPHKDSLVIECAGCTEEAARQVEHFEDSNSAAFDIANSQNLTLTLYSLGHRDVISLPGTSLESATERTIVPKPRLTRHRYREVTPPETPSSSSAAENKAAAKAINKVTLLKVTAAEGVAIYSDKTKRDVLRILPQGSSIVLLAKEGDLYSVSVDGEEGFVDAEAVEVQQ